MNVGNKILEDTNNDGQSYFEGSIRNEICGYNFRFPTDFISKYNKFYKGNRKKSFHTGAIRSLFSSESCKLYIILIILVEFCLK